MSTSGNAQTVTFTTGAVYEYRFKDDPEEGFLKEEPEGWHPCLKQKTRCVIEVYDTKGDAGYFGGERRKFWATNSCHVEDADVCPRVTEGCKTGEGYELCGPPLHAEAEAAKILLEYYPDGAPTGATAYLYGHDYMCGPCQIALVAAGVRNHVITGEPA